MHGEAGQATVEWVALVLAAALALAGAATLAAGQTDHDLGEVVAKRITKPAIDGPAAWAAAASAPALAAGAPAPAAGAPTRAARPRSRSPLRDRAASALRGLRGVAKVGRHAWIPCLGYRRWRHELAHPSAPNEAFPVHDALAIANECLNPLGYLFGD